MIKRQEELSGEIGGCGASGWEKKIDENEQYIFVLINEKSILRIDKDTNERICIAKAPKDSFIGFLYIYKEGLYYVIDQGELYRYNLTTGETKQIYVVKELLDSIFGLKIYKDNIYLYECGLGISRLDPETNKRKELVDDNVSHAVFYNNKLYNKISIYFTKYQRKERKQYIHMVIYEADGSGKKTEVLSWKKE